MLVITMKSVDVRPWRGYKTLAGKRMPPSVSMLDPEAADAFMKMTVAAKDCFELTDVFRTVKYQISSIKKATQERKRLFAPPTKSGHNFGSSIDIAVDETLENFRKSGDSELMAAGRSRVTLGTWMLQFGWHGIKKEIWHFDYLGTKYKTVVEKINDLYGKQMQLTNLEVQACLNKLFEKELDVPLKVDGVLGEKTHRVLLLAGEALEISREEAGTASPWFRRVLAGATYDIRMTE